PDRHLVALAELTCRVAVQPQDLRQRGGCVRANRAVAGGGGRDLGDRAHAHGMVVSAGQQRLTSRSAEGGGVEPVVAKTVCGKPLRDWCITWSAKGARRAEADVIEQDYEHIGGPRGGTQRLDRRIGGIGVLRVVCR